MRDEIMTYWDMCARAHGSLQRGMYFREPPDESIFLMSRRPGALYVDALSEDGTELEYEGHDIRREPGLDPKAVDQPWTLPNGATTENARFAQAVEKAKSRGAHVRVRVYEKLRPGIWSDRGLFHLMDYSYEENGGRRVFRFKMRLTEEPDEVPRRQMVADGPPTRVIPSWVKQTVYKRDKGRCVLCGAGDELHFDHDFPYSKGGTSVVPENVRLLCARHNLQKAAKIQ